MEADSYPPAQPRSYAWVWALAVVALLCTLLACCLLVAAALAAFFMAPRSVMSSTGLPPAVVTVPVSPSGPQATPAAARLDREGEPVHGNVLLQRGFSPDPYFLQVKAGGPVDTAGSGPECGFTTSSPSLRFILSGGASEAFLRILFRAGDYTDATLLLYAPDGAWYCTTAADGEPSLDFELAPSGEYNLWVGTAGKGATAEGTLYITQSPEFSP